MIGSIDRRTVLGGLALGTLALYAPQAQSQIKARIVIVGGGFGGATAARTLKSLLNSADITLVEANETYTSCPFSNLVIGSERSISEQSFSYQTLKQDGLSVVHQRAVAVDPVGQTVTMQDGTTLGYDRLILSPGVDLRWGALEGYTEATAERLPHAWKAGTQTTLLRQQLEALEDGENVIMTVPPAPFRCPPGPYERASLIAHYLKTRKPRSKLLVLDAKDRFSKMPLFLEAWAEHYPEHLEWRSASNDGTVSRVDAERMQVSTDFEDIEAAVINVIPPQKAATIAELAGVTDATGWCPIDPVSFESTLQPNIHVIGDATIAAPMPKSAFSANLQGKLCAMAVAQLLGGRAPEPTVLANTCYSYTTPNEAISIVGVYSNGSGKFESLPGAGGLSPLQAPAEIRQAEARQASDWFTAVTREAFG
ncbi:MAG: NAD(P)/FAD-dependent oxidoreductase [Pseudomonadota bacterium]